jgi:hypothetical protein
MESTLLTAGLACLIAAVIGGGLKAFSIEIPLLASWPRQIGLFVLGLLLCVIAFTMRPIPSRPPALPTEPKSSPVAVGACATGNAPSNVFHDSPASNGSWDWNCNGQIEREWGTCEALTREQCDPNTNVTGAPSGFCSELRGVNGCIPKVAACGTQGWYYPCFYNSADGRCHAGGYETATVMRCK